MRRPILKRTAPRASFLALLALVIVPYTAATAPVTAESAGLRKLVEAYQIAWNTHDASALSAFFTVDADMIMGNGPIQEGRTAIENW